MVQSSAWQERHAERRRALRVPHARQRMYIVRANQPVMRALTPSMPTSTAAFKRKSFNLCASPSISTGKRDRAHSLVETDYLAQYYCKTVASSTRTRSTTYLFVQDVVLLRNLSGSLLSRTSSRSKAPARFKTSCAASAWLSSWAWKMTIESPCRNASSYR